MTVQRATRKQPGTKTRQQQLGQYAEDLACRHLEAHGLTLVTRNFRCKVGEIDLIMTREQQLIFVEVRYRRQSAFGDAAASVTRSKQRKLINAANFFLLSHPRAHHYHCRFDVVGVDFQRGQNNIDWIPNAFS